MIWCTYIDSSDVPTIQSIFTQVDDCAQGRRQRNLHPCEINMYAFNTFWYNTCCFGSIINFSIIQWNHNIIKFDDIFTPSKENWTQQLFLCLQEIRNCYVNQLYWIDKISNTWWIKYRQVEKIISKGDVKKWWVMIFFKKNKIIPG